MSSELLFILAHRTMVQLTRHADFLGLVALSLAWVVWRSRHTQKLQRVEFFRRQLWPRVIAHHVLLISTAFGLGLFTFRLGWTGRFQFGFLPWNLFLAWIPLILGEILSGLSTQSRKMDWRQWMVAFAWLLFLPNAPYLVTDLIHWRPRPDAPVWFDLLILLHFAMLGLFLGFRSIGLVRAVFSARFGSGTKFWLTPVLLMLTSFGIYLGRFQRWNSWDVLTDPVRLFRDVAGKLINPWDHPRMCGFTGLCFIFLLLAFWLVEDARTTIHARDLSRRLSENREGSGGENY